MSISGSDIVFYSAGLSDANPFNPSSLTSDLKTHGVGCRVVSETWHPKSGGVGGFYYEASPESGAVSATIKLASGTLGDRVWVCLVDGGGDGWGALISYAEFRICPVVAYAAGSSVTFTNTTTAEAGDEYTIAIDGTALTTLKNGVGVGSYTVTEGSYRPSIAFSFLNSGNLAVSALGATGYLPEGAAINPTGTDTDLVNGSSASMVFTGLTSNPVSLQVTWDNGVDTPITTTQSGFSLGTVTDGGATATYTPTIGNLPYSDTTYGTGDYSFLVTCADDSEITLDTLTFSPEAGNEFITLASPVNDGTSVIPSETLVTGMQIEWPTNVLGDTVTINADATWEIDFDGEPKELVFDLGYWDLTTRSAIETTLTTSNSITAEGFTVRGFTAKGFTVDGFTARGF